MHLFKLPKIVTKRIYMIISNFLWADQGKQKKIHLVRLDVIYQNVENGGWGIRDLENFNMALLAKNL